MKEKGYNINVSKERFLELAINPETGIIEEKSIFEVEGGLQFEAQGMIKSPENRAVNLDFVAEFTDSGETIFIDHKGMIDFGKLAEEKGIDISYFPDHKSVAFNMGRDSVDQKQRFIGLEQGPKSSDEVLHVYNFNKIIDRKEVPGLVQAVLDGAEEAGNTKGIMFINYK